MSNPDDECDCCAMYESTLDALWKILECPKPPWGQDGRAWQCHHLIARAEEVMRQLNVKGGE